MKQNMVITSQTIPRASVSPKPLTDPTATKKRASAVTIVTASASSEVMMPCLAPETDACLMERPMRISSRKRSSTKIEESAAEPVVSTTPARPGSVSAKAPKCERSAKSPR